MLRAEYTTQFKKNLKLARLRCHDLGAESKAPAWIVPNVLHRAPHTGGVTPPAKVTSNRVGRDLRARRIRAVTPPASARLSCATNGQSPGITHATRLAGRVTPKSQTKAERLRPTLPAVKTMTVILKFFPDYGHGEGRRPRRPRRAARPRPLPSGWGHRTNPIPRQARDKPLDSLETSFDGLPESGKATCRLP